MKKIFPQLFNVISLQLFIYFFVNSLFIFKFVPRLGISPFPVFLIYLLIVLGIIFLYKKYSSIITENTFKKLYWMMIGMVIISIIGIFIVVDPYSLRVDRWSALTFFWDSLLQGNYPYAAHTHVAVKNFASPFPLWHVISFPFYLLGDVGIEIIFFLIISAIAVHKFFSSYRTSFFFYLMLFLAPAYWWEVSVRSDSLNNALLVFMIILWYSKKEHTISSSFKYIILISGIIASTRMTALLPLAIFFFQPYLKFSTTKKIVLPFAILGIALLTFLPFIFWDTDTWIFFSRNPFMSQGYNGSIYILLLMIPIGIYLSLKWKTTEQFFNLAGFFVFFFIFISLIDREITLGDGYFFSDGVSDISYFTLAFPYCLASLSSSIIVLKSKIN